MIISFHVLEKKIFGHDLGFTIFLFASQFQIVIQDNCTASAFIVMKLTLNFIFKAQRATKMRIISLPKCQTIPLSKPVCCSFLCRSLKNLVKM